MPSPIIQNTDRERHRMSSGTDSDPSRTPDSNSSAETPREQNESKNLIKRCEDYGQIASEILKEQNQVEAAEQKLTQELQIVAKAFKVKEALLEKRKEELEEKKEALNSTRAKKSRELLYKIGEISKGAIEMAEKRREDFFQNVDWKSFEAIKQDGEAVVLEEEEIAKEEAELEKWKEEMEKKEKEKEELHEKLVALRKEYTKYCKAILKKETMKMMEPGAERFKVSKEDEPAPSQKTEKQGQVPLRSIVLFAMNDQKGGQKATPKVEEAKSQGKENTSVAVAPEVTVAQSLSDGIGGFESSNTSKGNDATDSSTAASAQQDVQTTKFKN